MISKKIVIYDDEILFEILVEIKDILSFEIEKINHNDLKYIVEKSSPETIFITREKINNIKNQLVIEDIPIKIGKLLRLINLQYLKNKYISQSDILIGRYNLNLNSREIKKENLKISLTERETSLILFLFESDNAVKIDQIQREVWSHTSKLETHTVETHIYRLRKKIKEVFGDDDFIKSTKTGYLIN